MIFRYRLFLRIDFGITVYGGIKVRLIKDLFLTNVNCLSTRN